MTLIFRALAISLLSSCIYAQSNIEKLGDYLQILIPVYGVYLGTRDNDKEGLIQFSKSIGSSIATTYALKYGVARQRPDGSNAMSFPSGHTVSAFSGAFFISQRYPNTIQSIVAYSLASFVGYSRVYAKKHYVSDVLAGALLSYGFSRYFVDENFGITAFANENKTSLHISWRQ